MGKLLWLDLSSSQIDTEEIAEDVLHDYIGGYGLGARLLYDRIPACADPLGPDSILGFLTGPLTGTTALIGSRYVVVGKSPKTGTWGDANSGGYFGPELKFAGYDGILVRGISPDPVYLLIEDDNAELRDASDLWGMRLMELERALRKRHGERVRVCSIGPAGEQVSLLAAVMNDYHRAAGRSGLGALMGSKRLKAIVVRGEKEVPVADAEGLRRLRAKYLREYDEDAYALFRDEGTCGITAESAYSGDSPVKNWGGIGVRDFGDDVADKISDDSVLAYQQRKFNCYRCPLGCGGVVKLEHGPFALDQANDYQGYKPEYETLAAFGSMLLNDNLGSIIKANEICNDYGLDTISTGSTVAFAIECREQGLLSERDVDGLDLRWGNAEAIVALTRKIARREGVGELLADGIVAAATRIGEDAWEYAIEVGGEELPMHDPRFWPGTATAYILDGTPGRHTQGSEMLPPPGLGLPEHDKYEYSGKAENHRKLVNLTHVMNSAGICLFAYMTFYIQSLPDQLSAVTGWKYSLEDLYPIGERIGTLRHLFNLREGLNPLLRRIPDRMVGVPPQDEGPLEGVTVDYRTQIREYLELIGWDPKTTVPSADSLRVLGLDELVDEAANFQVPAAEGWG